MSMLCCSLFESSSLLDSCHPLFEGGQLSGPPCWDLLVEDVVYFFEGLLDSLGIGEKGVNRSNNAECAEDQVCLPLNVRECWRNKESKRKVEAVNQCQ